MNSMLRAEKTAEAEAEASNGSASMSRYASSLRVLWFTGSLRVPSATLVCSAALQAPQDALLPTAQLFVQ